MTGYLHRSYAASLSEFGTPSILPKSGGWILKRQIPGFPYHDAMGCYPLFTCQDWSQLHADLEDVRDGLVSLALVTDPFGDYDADYLRQCFEDVVVPFKEHFVVDLSQPASTLVSSHHRRCARRALRCVEVERCQDPTLFLSEWVELYRAFIGKRNIKGPAALSRSSLAQQLTVPGIILFRASREETVLGMHLWYINGDIGYAHLAAYTDLAYKLGASYALFWSAIEYFTASGLRWLQLGGAAGVKSNGGDGLTEFKRGWSTGTRIAYFCGRIFDRERYSQIVKAKDVSLTSYFPAYREGEFA
jgi:Acetyltransferase (GNAT) domain